MERTSYFEKYTRITSLEDVLIKLGLNPKDINATQDIIKKKNEDIQALRKRLKLPTTEHP